LLIRHERRAREQSKARQARLDRQRKQNHERRAREQSEARQARLGGQPKYDHECRSRDQSEARQARADNTSMTVSARHQKSLRLGRPH